MRIDASPCPLRHGNKIALSIFRCFSQKNLAGRAAIVFAGCISAEVVPLVHTAEGADAGGATNAGDPSDNTELEPAQRQPGCTCRERSLRSSRSRHPHHQRPRRDRRADCT